VFRNQCKSGEKSQQPTQARTRVVRLCISQTSGHAGVVEKARNHWWTVVVVVVVISLPSRQLPACQTPTYACLQLVSSLRDAVDRKLIQTSALALAQRGGSESDYARAVIFRVNHLEGEKFEYGCSAVPTRVDDDSPAWKDETTSHRAGRLRTLSIESHVIPIYMYVCMYVCICECECVEDSSLGWAGWGMNARYTSQPHAQHSVLLVARIFSRSCASHGLTLPYLPYFTNHDAMPCLALPCLASPPHWTQGLGGSFGLETRSR
jgi:hypothetical protein